MVPFKEVKRTLNGRRTEYACELLERSEGYLVLRYRLPHAGRVADLTLPVGTVTYAHYWADRPYNVYHWIAPDGATLAHYINLSDDVAIRGHEIEWRDLAVDILRTPDGRVQVLDADELSAAPGWLRARIAQAQDEVLQDLEAIVTEVGAATKRLRSRRGASGIQEESGG